MKNYTTKRTELPIIILTDYEHKTNDVLERVRQEIETAGFHLQSIFNSLKRSALFVERDFENSDNESVKYFCSDLMNFSDIGNGIAMSIWKSISDLTELQTKENAESETANQAVSAPLTLAEQISNIITHPEIPPEISEALQDGVNEAMNISKQTEVLEYEKSSEYIAKVLRDYSNK